MENFEGDLWQLSFDNLLCISCIEQFETVMRGFMEDLPVAERVVMGVNVPRGAKCPMCQTL